MGEQACGLLRVVCNGTSAAACARKQRAAEAGALEAAVAMMRAHPQSAAVQEAACGAFNICVGADGASVDAAMRGDAAGLARKQRVAVVGVALHCSGEGRGGRSSRG